MMNKRLFSILAAGTLLLFGLAACGSNDSGETTTTSAKKENKVIKVASHLPPMTDVVELAGDVLEKDGWQVELIQVSDNIQYNELVNHKEADASFAQHEPYMQMYNKEKNGNLTAVQKIYNAKVGYYSKQFKSIDELPEGAKIAIPNDLPNEGRALAILNEAGLIKLKDGVGFEGTVKDIEENPKQFELVPLDLLNLPEAYNEDDIAMTYNYPTYIAKVGLTPKDAILLEKTIDERFAISLVAREDNEASEAIQALKQAMTSETVKKFLEDNHSDTLVPAF